MTLEVFHYSVPSPGLGRLHFLVIETNEKAALERLRADDRIWRHAGVEYHGSPAIAPKRWTRLWERQPHGNPCMVHGWIAA